MPSGREAATRLVMLLGFHLPADLQWLREVLVGANASDAELVEALMREARPSAARVLCEARLVAVDVSLIGGR